MKLGVCIGLYHDRSLEEVLDSCTGLGVEGVEIGIGASGEATKHIDAPLLLSSNTALQKYLDIFKRRGMYISTLNCPGNPVHPIEEIAAQSRKAFQSTVMLCEKMGMDKIVLFSGTPGGCPQDRTPNWVTCPWPDENLTILRYQWDDVLVPYWKKAAAFAAEHGVTKFAFEMHPGFCVYNPETLLKLRDCVGPAIGSNFDPSHLMWQGMDAALAILELKEAVFSVHAKDVFVNKDYILRNGVNDAKHYGEFLRRAWTFRTVGYGHGEDVWRRIISALLSIGYDGTINIEHEDIFLSRTEGLTKAAAFLRGILVKEPPEEMWWA